MNFKLFKTLFLANLVWSIGIHATTIKPESKEAKIRKSPYICAVEILDSQAKDNGKGYIRTLSNAKVIDCMKGDLSGIIQLELPGGSLEKTYDHGGKETITSMVVGAPKFRVGESVVLHLKSDQSKEGYTVYKLSNWEVERLEKIEHQNGANYVLQSNSDEDLESYRESVDKALE